MSEPENENMAKTWSEGSHTQGGHFALGHRESVGNKGGGRPRSVTRGLPDELRECLRTLFTVDDLKRLKTRLMELLDDPKVTGMALIQLGKLIFELVGDRPGQRDFAQEVSEVRSVVIALRQEILERKAV